MFKLVKGVHVPNLQGIHEGYKMESKEDYTFFSVNVSEENIENLFKKLCSCVRTPAFLVIEVPTNGKVEEKIRKNDTDPFHNDVYYLDGGSYIDLLNVFDKYKELLINDGFINFGFGSHKGYDEVFIVDYKIFHIYTDEPEKYLKVLNELGIKADENYKTVWENFSHQSPGGVLSIEVDGLTIYDMVEELKKSGLYLSERRENK